MAAPDLSQIKHDHIRQRAASKLATKRLKDIIGSLLVTAMMAGLGAVFLGFLFFFIGSMSRSDFTGQESSFLSSYLLAFFLIAGAILAYMGSTEGFSSPHEMQEAVASDFQEDAELTRKEEWERGAPEREAARQRELAAQQAREAKARADAMRAEAQSQFDRRMWDYNDAMKARSQRTTELASLVARHFADFAMELHLQGITDPGTLARRYATERLPVLVSENGAELGLVRDMRGQLTPAMQQVAAYLPPAPPPLVMPIRPALLTAT